ncbi:MAG: hypothetical protein AB1497_05960 [Bacillota bacterium]
MKRRVTYMVLSGVSAVAAALIASAWINRALPAGNVVLKSILVFGAVRVVGEVWFLLFRERSTLYVEDMGREMLLYLAAGAVAGFSILAAIRFLGSPVDPAIPAIGMHTGLLILGRGEANRNL